MEAVLSSSVSGMLAVAASLSSSTMCFLRLFRLLPRDDVGLVWWNCESH
jgi:hypothetical protein